MEENASKTLFLITCSCQFCLKMGLSMQHPRQSCKKIWMIPVCIPVAIVFSTMLCCSPASLSSCHISCQGFKRHKVLCSHSVTVLEIYVSCLFTDNRIFESANTLRSENLQLSIKNEQLKQESTEIHRKTGPVDGKSNDKLQVWDILVSTLLYLYYISIVRYLLEILQ